MTPGVSLYGGFGGGETVRSRRNWKAHPAVITVGGQSVGSISGADDAVLDGFTITEFGFGMYTRSCSPRVANCLFMSNATGIRSEGGGSPTIVDCTFRSNFGYYGFGAGISNFGCTPTIEGCLFSQSSGSAIYNDGPSITVRRCAFDQNSYGGIMSQVSSSDCAITVENCGFTGNLGGGGIYCTADGPSGAVVKVTNCLFARNSAEFGGGMSCRGVTAILTNCTFTHNTATGYGTTAGQGGGFLQYAADTTATNCIFWGNTAGEGPEVYVESGTLTARYSCIPPGYGDDHTFYLDPLFIDAANGSLRVQTGSPCIDSGTADGAPAMDIGGTQRPQGAGFDIGAYEW